MHLWDSDCPADVFLLRKRNEELDGKDGQKIPGCIIVGWL
jgi:hypothetical protein